MNFHRLNYTGAHQRGETLFSPDDCEDVLWMSLASWLREAFGITSMMYAFTHSKYMISRTGIMPSIYLRHSYPEDYLRTFPNGLTLEESITANLILQGQTALLWSEVAELAKSEKQKFRLAADLACGMGVGVSFGFRFGANSGISALCLAAQHADAADFKQMVEANRHEIEAVASDFDAIMRPKMIRSQIHLTPRERDVLAYSAGGMTTKQIAQHLALSPKTVSNTLERARHALGAVSTMEAVAKALVYELID